ncbi:alanine racemase [Bacillus luteolus]|uniref:Alanine racemase n=1 Tax=Litchfieldia luteola TaxID=682179 RepID=A0ABR9QMD5_9BACI|nr:alanine racemase [Cytobacillus luteolus]MBE4909668.1 alanine racemase [Cytobacillus luteolus]MBP1944578.1 alanine racemase [Cytobacillus luteolus]
MEISSFYRDSWVEIDLDCIYKNVRSMKHFLPETSGVMAVVKANAYGHGDAMVANVALEAGATYLAVAFLDEALSLRQQNIQAPILVLGAVRPEDLKIAAENNITLTVFQADWLKEARERSSFKEPVSFHLKFDTGMGRLGIKDQTEVNELLNMIEEDDQLTLEGAYTHFATADELDTTYFNHQYERFVEMVEWLPVRPKIIHCGNSATGFRFPEKVFNYVRFGIGMYGLTPSLEIKNDIPFQLHEAFSLQSRLVHVKKIKKGENISYGATYTAPTDEWVGTVPVGYADGWSRKLQDSEVLVAGTRCPIIGRVCMDQFMVRLPYELARGEKVTLIGFQGDNNIGIDEVAKNLDTINYEVPCLISYRVPRIFLRNKSIIEVRNPVLVNH